MKQRLILLALTVALISAFVLAPVGIAAAQNTNPFKVAVSVPVTNELGEVVGTFDGTVTVQKFSVQDGTLVAGLKVVGTVTDAAGNVITTVKQTVTAPVTINQATCEILVLDIGPIHLDLLGLVIDISEIHIEITAEQGGGLLGDLLCAIADAFDGGLLQDLADLLNRLLRLFR